VLQGKLELPLHPCSTSRLQFLLLSFTEPQGWTHLGWS